MFRSSEPVKPRLFKVFDHQEDHLLVEEAAPEARKNNIKLDLPDLKKRFLRHYYRERLALAGTVPVLKSWDALPPKTEPVDDELLPNWLNTQGIKSLGVRDGLMLDLKRPIEIDMILVPNELM